MINETQNTPNLAITWVAQIFGLIGLLMWSFSALFSPMLFTKEANWQTWFLFTALHLIPISLLISNILLWWAFHKHKIKLWQACIFWLIASPVPLVLFQ